MMDETSQMGKEIRRITLALAPVSYTHLDVYKRQAYVMPVAVLV